ncbi:MAG: hypothetical protein FWC17_06875, partial [Treponema sp.]|nr:hypothetical protein [Treponema sp.]
MMRFCFKLLFVTFLFLTALPLYPRDLTIVVNDADLDIPLEGALVRVRGGSDYICGADGSVFIRTADNRQIVVQAFYPGYETGVFNVPLTGDFFIIGLRLSGIMEGRELV